MKQADLDYEVGGLSLVWYDRLDGKIGINVWSVVRTFGKGETGKTKTNLVVLKWCTSEGRRRCSSASLFGFVLLSPTEVAHGLIDIIDPVTALAKRWRCFSENLSIISGKISGDSVHISRVATVIVEAPYITCFYLLLYWARLITFYILRFTLLQRAPQIFHPRIHTPALSSAASYLTE